MNKITTTLSLLTAMLATSTYAAVITQTTANSGSGSANYGLEFELNSTFFTEDQVLDSITFYWQDKGGPTGSMFVDIYSLSGTQDATSPDFSSTNTSGDMNLSYLGSSTNSIDYGAITVASTAMEFTFSGITLARDVDLFAVFSTDDNDGNWVGASTDIATSGYSYTNIAGTGSDPLFGGVGDSDSQDLTYDIQMSAVPEPSAALLGGLGALLLLRRRR